MMTFKKCICLLLLICLFCPSLPAIAQQEQIQWEYNKVITEGGVYSGNYRSDDPNRAAVEIQTFEPVYFIGAQIVSRGICIRAMWYGGTITIKNCVFENLNPLVKGHPLGRVCDIQGVKNLIIENNYFNHTGGLYFLHYTGNQTPEQTIKIRYNKFKNIDGRASAGPQGGYIASDKNADGSETGWYRVQAIQFNQLSNLKYAEIAWNEVENEPFESRSEDVINFYCSSGTEDSPISVHHNFIFGSYPGNPLKDGHSGGGIIVEGNPGENELLTSQYINIHNNIVVNTTNYGIAIAGGRYNKIYDNLAISSGKLPDGRSVVATNVGIYVANYTGDRFMGNNQAYNNVSNWIMPNGYNNAYGFDPDLVDEFNNTSLPWVIDTQLEQEPKEVWQGIKEEAGVETGVQSAYVVRPCFIDDTTAVIQNVSDKPFYGKIFINATGNTCSNLLAFKDIELVNGTDEVAYQTAGLSAGTHGISIFSWNNDMQPFSKKITQTITVP